MTLSTCLFLCTYPLSVCFKICAWFHHFLYQYYLNVLQQLLLAPADILQLLLLLWGKVVRHWGGGRGWKG